MEQGCTISHGVSTCDMLLLLLLWLLSLSLSAYISPCLFLKNALWASLAVAFGVFYSFYCFLSTFPRVSSACFSLSFSGAHMQLLLGIVSPSAKLLLSLSLFVSSSVSSAAVSLYYFSVFTNSLQFLLSHSFLLLFLFYHSVPFLLFYYSNLSGSSMHSLTRFSRPSLSLSVLPSQKFWSGTGHLHPGSLLWRCSS